MDEIIDNLDEHRTRQSYLRKMVAGIDFAPLFEVWNATGGGIAEEIEFGVLSAFYEKCAEDALDVGEVFIAAELSRHGRTAAIKAGFDQVRFFQIEALALARAGATRAASSILLRLSKVTDDPESVGLLARTFRDLAWAEESASNRRVLFREGFTYAHEAFEKHGAYYNGIQAAQFAFFAGDVDEVRIILRKVRKICAVEEGKDHEDDSKTPFWINVTLAEAALILGDVEEAKKRYTSMLEFEDKFPAPTEATRRVAFKIIEQHGDPEKFEDLASLLIPRPVLAFSGHQFDTATAPGRFGVEDAERISSQISDRLDLLRPQAAVSSLSLGADLLFVEQVLAKRIPVMVVLAFDLDSTIGQIRDRAAQLGGEALAVKWSRRLDWVITEMKPSEFHEVNFPPDQPRSAAYAHMNRLVTGMALLKAKESGADVIPMVVCAGDRGELGGTSNFLENLAPDMLARTINLF